MKKIIFLLLFFYIKSVSCQEQKVSYDMVNSFSEYYFYNGVIIENKLFIGTSSGAAVYDIVDQSIDLIDTSIKGYIKNDGGSITNGDIVSDNVYNYLLPESYNSAISNHIIFNNEIFIFSKGTLFIFSNFKKNIYQFNSVRAISENYIGTYGGIYNRKEKKFLEFPSFTNSYIRELDNLTFINWDGLSILNDDQQLDFFNKETIGLMIEKNEMGYAEDIVKIDKDTHILSTSKGLYLLDLTKKNIVKLQNITNGVYSLENVDYKVNKAVRIIVNDDNTIYRYNPQENILKPIIRFDEKIIDIHINKLNSGTYVLFTNKLKLIDNLNYIENIQNISDDITNPHNIGEFKNYIYVTSNNGLSLLNIKSNEFKTNLIKDEFNKKAHYVDEYSLQIGSINGLYILSYDDLNHLFFSNNDNIIVENVIITKKQLLIIILCIPLFIFLIVYVILKIKSKKNNFEKNENEIIIKKYIDKNLSTVSVKSICSKFKISLNKLYEIMENQRPGHYIHEKRINLTKTLLKEGKKLNEISKKTGFSVSYLNQIIKNLN